MDAEASGLMRVLLVFSAYSNLFSDWPRAYSEFSTSEPCLGQTCVTYRQNVSPQYDDLQELFARDT